MSGFAPDWLALREPVDHRSRNRALLDKLATHFAGRAEATIFDLGAGLGSNLRGTFAALPPRQHWVLVDYDPLLLSAASEAIAKWADTTRPTTSGVEAIKDGRSIHVELKRHDLAADPAPWGAMKPDLVTAAALFDLMSEKWIERFTAALAKAQLPFYTVLTHDAATEWKPPHPADAAMKTAFESHFGGDKGFGPSVGGSASRLMAENLERAGYKVERGSSPWVLGAGNEALIEALARGWAQAVSETGRVDDKLIQDWLKARSPSGTQCVVGHEDLLALPG
jgi:hypothetical protein